MTTPGFCRRACSCLILGLGSALPLAAAVPQLPVLPPDLDPAKIINSSYNFLEEREPEMTEVEHALYTRMIPIVERTPELALELLETMLADDKPESAAFEFVLGNVYFTLQRPEGAELHLRKAVDQHPQFLRAWVNLGAVYYAAGRYRDAIPCFAKAIALGEREASTFGLMASALRENGNFFAAESAYKQAMTAEPDNPDWINGLLEIYLKTEQHPPAAALARELLQTKPEEPRNWTLYSGLLVLLNRPAEAIAVLQAGGDLDTITPEAWHVLGDLYAEAQLPREAAAAYARTDSGPEGNRALLYVRTLVQEKRLDEAEGVLAQWPDNPPRDLEVPLHQVRAELARARGQVETARQELEAALRLDPLNGPVLLALAGFHRDNQELAQAELLYEQAVRQPSSAFAAHVELAQLAVRAYDYDGAIAHAQAALSLQPSEDLQEFLTRIKTLAAHEKPRSAG